MNSIEKVHLALEEMADAEDEDLTEAIPVPIPPTMLRSFMPVIAHSIPEDPGDLDLFLTQVGDFCHSLRSDHEPAPA
jgi:hypothetical protein